MKTTKIISACAVLVALASCSNDQELSQQSAEDTSIRIQANVGGIATRATSNIQGNQFDAGGKIGIFLKEHLGAEETNVATYSNPIEGTVNSNRTDIDLGSPQYFPANGRSVDCLAIYPMKIGSKNIDKSTTSFSVEADQSTDANYKASDLMYAYKANTAKKTPIQLTFKHLLSKIIVEVVADASVSNSVLSHVYVDLLDTKKTINISVPDIAQGSVSSDKTVTVGSTVSDPTTIELGHPTYSNGNKTGEVAAIIVPQTIAKTTPFIRVRLNDGSKDYATYTYNVSDASGLTFATGTSYKYTITLKSASISVKNVQITPWNVGTPGSGDANLD